MDPIKQLASPVAEVRKHVEQWVDEYGDTWAIVDGIETKVAYSNPVALIKRQDGVRVEIRKGLDELGIRDRTVKETITVDGQQVEVEMLPPGDGGANILQFNMDPTPANITKATAQTEAAERALAAASAPPPPKPSLWQRLKRAAKRFNRRKARRCR